MNKLIKKMSKQTKVKKSKIVRFMKKYKGTVEYENLI